MHNKSWSIIISIALVSMILSPLFGAGSVGASPSQAAMPKSGMAQKASAAGMPNDEIGGKQNMGQMRTTTNAMRVAAGAHQAPKGVNKNFGGVNPSTMGISPLSVQATEAVMAPLATPDYFGVANYANSPLPQIDPLTGQVTAGTGIRKFIDTLPGLCGVPIAGGTPANSLGQCIPMGIPDKVTFPGSDYYEIAVVEYREQMSPDLPGSLTTKNGVTSGPTLLRGYVQLVPANTPNAVKLTTADGKTDLLDAQGHKVYGAYKPHYLGPIIIAQGCDPAAAAACVPTPVRVKFTNLLPTGPAGDLFIPTDTTYMGAGMGPGGSITSVDVKTAGVGYLTPPTVVFNNAGTNGSGAAANAEIINGKVVRINVTNGGNGYTTPPVITLTGGGATTAATVTAVLGGKPGDMYTQNRATLHLHGGNTPWISDGTPHQWTTPANEFGVGTASYYSKGVGVAYVPDMWYSKVTGAVVTSCSKQTTCNVPNASNDPGLGSLTFYWTNQQSGRLMFYHDHSYGITRLNVEAGEAAGYLLVDQGVEQALKTAGVPGTLDAATMDLAHLVPLVIQDKTFVPDNGAAGGQLAATDPTWDLQKYGGMGNLWFPHVYMPNQNPADISGSNAYGRWDYGPWFWPAQNPATFVPDGQPVPCTSSFYDVNNPPAWGPLMCPGTPNPSGTPESFLDTPVVNGAVYPSLTVDPTAYRFQILNAGNDRTLNLSWFKADPITIALTNAGLGYTTPPTITITGGGGSGATASPVMSNGSITAITGTKVGWGYNVAPNVTITGNGTGATATAIVDKVTQTISGYSITNGGSGYSFATVTVDAPLNCVADPTKQAPLGICATATAVATLAPAGSLLAIQVTNPGTGYTSAPTISVAAPTAGGTRATAVASVNSEPIMVAAHPHDGTNGIPPCTLSNIDNSMGPNLALAQLDSNGNPLNGTGLQAGCYPDNWPTDGRDGGVPDPLSAGPAWVQLGTEGGSLPAPVVIPPSPVMYEFNRRSITVLNIFNHGLLLGPAERADVVVDFSKFAGQTILLYNDAPAPVPAFDSRTDYYTGDPDQTGSGGAPTTLPGYGPNTRTVMQVKVNATAGGTSVANVAVTNSGSGYTAPAASIAASPAGGTNANATAAVTGSVTGLTVTNAGTGYTNPTITFQNATGDTSGTGAAASASGGVSGLTIGNPGSGYTSMPSVTISGGSGSLATATAAGSVDPTVVVSNNGAGYTNTNVTLTAPPTGGTQATASATGAVDSLTVNSGGAPVSTAPAVTLTAAPAGGTNAQAAATISVTAITTSGGQDYQAAPTIQITDTGAGTGASAIATVAVTSAVFTGGSGYAAAPSVQITDTGTPTTPAAATATISITGLTLTNFGLGYTAGDKLTIKNTPPGSETAAVFTVDSVDVDGVIQGITIQTAGAGITTPGAIETNGAGTGAAGTISGAVDSITISTPGAGYTNPSISFTGTSTTPATATTRGAVDSVTLTPGTLYTNPGVIVTNAVTDTTGTGFAPSVTGIVDGLTITAAGSGYTTAPSVNFTTGTASATATLKITAVTVTNPGAGYITAPTVIFAGNNSAVATTTLHVSSLTVTSAGTGFTTNPNVVLSAPQTGVDTATATASITTTGITLTNGGSGYTKAPTVIITDPTGTGAAATATLGVNSITLTNPGSGYTTAPVVTITDTLGTGNGATAKASLASPAVFNVTPLNAALTSIWQNNQDKVIIPQPAYPVGNGHSATPNYTRIQDNYVNGWLGNPIGGVTLVSGGANYQATPSVSFVGGGGIGAAATATILGSVQSIAVGNAGAGYTTPPAVTINGVGTGATATSTLKVVRITVTNGGNGYTKDPTITLSAPAAGTTAKATATRVNNRVTAITVTIAGSGYTSVPSITITRAAGTNTGSGAQATVAMGVGAITVTAPGANYTDPTSVTIASPGNGNGNILATASATLSAAVTSLTLTNPGTGYTSAPQIVFNNQPGDLTGAGASAIPHSQHMEPKAIQELFTLDYGRMNATLGVEIPFTNFANQTTIPYGYVEPPTELLTNDTYQVWKITHNGVDTHFMHFHLFNVQVINRVGWDGAIKPPEANEIGWKDTVRMNPLEDIIVAMKVLKQDLPWDLPLSQRPLDVTTSIGSTNAMQFSGVDPAGQPAPVVNAVTNFGYEYVWHCHILGHEENDMMRSMVLGFAPQAPTNLVVSKQTGNPITSRAVKLVWKDNSLAETGYVIERSTDNGVSWTASFNVPAMPGTGGTVTYFDQSVEARRGYSYRVYATNVVGYTQKYAAPIVGYPSIAYNSQPTPMSAQIMTNSNGGTGLFALVGASTDFLFAHNFESGTAGWTGTVGNVITTTQAALGQNGGTAGMAVNFGAAPEDMVNNPAPAPAYVFDTTANNATQYDASFMFSPNGSDTGSNPINIFTGQDQTDQAAFGVQYQLDVDRESGYHIQAWVMQNGVQKFIPLVDVSNAPHYIEVAWEKGTKAGFSLYVDGKLAGTILGDTSSQTLGKVLLGPASGMSGTTSGMIYLDDFFSSKVNGVFWAWNYLPIVTH